MDKRSKEEINELVSDREKFNNFVYTPLDEAVSLLKDRKSEKELLSYVSRELGDDIPKIFQTDKYLAVLFRHIVTPNYETLRFLDIADSLEGFQVILGEFTEDKFTTNNELKYALGRLGVFVGGDKKGGSRFECYKIIDIDNSDGKRICDVDTLWGQSLVDFHHDLFGLIAKRKHKPTMIDGSSWLRQFGNSARDFYKYYLMLFLTNGILFENVLINEENELDFTKNIFLPAFFKILKESGSKPLIVALEPTEIEEHRFWPSYPLELRGAIKSKISPQYELL